MKFDIERLCRKPLKEIPYKQPEIIFSEKVLGFLIDGRFHTEQAIAEALNSKVWIVKRTIHNLMQYHAFGSKQVGKFKAWKLLETNNG
ncbi:hypothetical protein KKJFFJLC_00045 [Vibrio phage vB_VpaS_PGB]|nr:hypothetical protein HHKILHMN_00052 [Vibrio phage vB_VpaS_PGA]WVH05588.1 hypothetical protein KKJFFJLC_00045 [Vibrio phage vB_VpaS_PGB]